MMILQAHAPFSHRNPVHLFINFPRGVDLTTILITAKDVHAGIRWILEYVQQAAVRQVTPYQLAIPRPTVGSLGKK
jgi:hypothetical protein